MLLFYEQGGGLIKHVLGKVDPTQRFYYLQTGVILQERVILPLKSFKLRSYEVMLHLIRVKLQLGLKPLRRNWSHSVYSETGISFLIRFLAHTNTDFFITIIITFLDQEHFSRDTATTFISKIFSKIRLFCEFLGLPHWGGEELDFFLFWGGRWLFPCTLWVLLVSDLVSTGGGSPDYFFFMGGEGLVFVN